MTVDSPHCSFCEKTRDQVAIVITSETAAICDECVDLCLDMLVDRGVYLVTYPRLRSVGRKISRWLHPPVKAERR